MKKGMAIPYVFWIKMMWSHQWNWHKRNKIFWDTWCLSYRPTAVNIILQKNAKVYKPKVIIYFYFFASSYLIDTITDSVALFDSSDFRFWEKRLETSWVIPQYSTSNRLQVRTISSFVVDEWSRGVLSMVYPIVERSVSNNMPNSTDCLMPKSWRNSIGVSLWNPKTCTPTHEQTEVGQFDPTLIFFGGNVPPSPTTHEQTQIEQNYQIETRV